MCSWDINAHSDPRSSRLIRSFGGEWITMALQLPPGAFGIPHNILEKDGAQNVCQYPIIDWITAESLLMPRLHSADHHAGRPMGGQCHHGWQCQMFTKEKFCWQHRLNGGGIFIPTSGYTWQSLYMHKSQFLLMWETEFCQQITRKPHPLSTTSFELIRKKNISGNY